MALFSAIRGRPAVLTNALHQSLKTLAGVDKVVCLGKQYLEHAKELGDAIPEMPVIFNKFGSITYRGSPDKPLSLADVLPKDKGKVHYEAEICIQLGVAGSIKAVSLGLDLTLRDLQKKLKQDGHPWEISKCFNGSAVVGPWIPVEEFEDYLEHEFQFVLDGEVKQRGKGKEMRMAPEQAIEYVDAFFPLQDGDVVFTGTPAGVGEVKTGQTGELIWGDRLRYAVKF